MGRGRPTTQVIPGKPPQGGRPNIRNPFQPLESATIRGRGGRETEPGYAIGPADGLIPYVNDPRLKGKKLDYSKSPYRMIRNQYDRFDQPPKPKKDIGIGGGPGVPPKFPVKDRPISLPPGFVCPDPDMNILMSNGSQKKAGDLLVGDLVKTYHEESFKLGNYEVEHVDIVNDVEKIKLTFDKNTIICSLSHKFYVGDSWKEAKDMVIGDVVSDNKLVAIESVEDGDVVHITVKDAHTYICEGLLSHNKSPRRDPIGPRDPRRPGRRRRPSRPVGRRMLPRPRPPKDNLGPPPEREVPIPKERLPRITRESDPRGPAPFSPDERGDARDRFFEKMFDKADERKQQSSMKREERRAVRQARNEERRARRDQPREINVGNERREIGRSMLEERVARRMQPGEIDVGGEIDINAERGGRRRRGGMRRNRRGRRRDFTSRRSRMMGGRRGRSMEERAAFRDRYVSSLRGGFFS